MKDPPPVFSPASQSVTLPSLKSGWRFIKRETEQASKTTDRPFLPTLLSQDRGRERNSSVVHFFFFFSLLSAKERKLFLMNTENETKEKERKKELKFIQRYYEMHRRRSPWINPCSRSFTADRSRMNASFPQNGSGRSRWSTGWNATRKYGVWTNESPNAPRIIAPLLIQIRERASSSSSSPPRRRAYCNTSFENSHHWVPHPWGACSRVTLVT